MTALTAAIRAIEPGAAQADTTFATEFLTKLLTVAVSDTEEDQTGNQVGSDQHPADRGNSQVVIERTTTTTEQPGIARHNCQDGRQSKNEKPGTFMLSESYFHKLATDFLRSPLRSDACTRGNTSPSCHAPCHSRDRFHAEQPGIAGIPASPTQPFPSNQGTLQTKGPLEEQACQAPYRSSRK